jgi:hypothetical protein
MTHPPLSRAILLGRWLAFCTHPQLAARVLPRAERCLLVGTWFAAVYLIVLAGLLVIRP